MENPKWKDKPKTLPVDVFPDDRGVLKALNIPLLSELGAKRFYQVTNHESGFIRAWHGHMKETKILYVAQGSALVYTAPLLERSETEMIAAAQNLVESPSKYYFTEDFLSRFVLSDAKPEVLYVPAGYVNGWKSLTPDTILLVFSTVELQETKDDDYRFDWTYVDYKIWEDNYR